MCLKIIMIWEQWYKDNIKLFFKETRLVYEWNKKRERGLIGKRVIATLV